jgi:hypothetical protein
LAQRRNAAAVQSRDLRASDATAKRAVQCVGRTWDQSRSMRAQAT